jgi:hypothetical protein
LHRGDYTANRLCTNFQLQTACYPRSLTGEYSFLFCCSQSTLKGEGHSVFGRLWGACLAERFRHCGAGDFAGMAIGGLIAIPQNPTAIFIRKSFDIFIHSIHLKNINYIK